MLKVLRFLIVVPIRLYQYLISPLLPTTCNYYPTCSEYSRQAVMKHGVFRGLLMGLMRIGRCSARYYGGNDPVPGEFKLSELKAEYPQRSVRRHRRRREHDE